MGMTPKVTQDVLTVKFIQRTPLTPTTGTAHRLLDTLIIVHFFDDDLQQFNF